MAVKKQTFMKGVFVIMGSQILIKVLGFIYRIIQTNFPQFADVGNSYYGSGYQVYTFILAMFWFIYSIINILFLIMISRTARLNDVGNIFFKNGNTYW